MRARPSPFFAVKMYSRFVRFSKLTLSILLIIVLVFMVAVPLIVQRGSDMRLAFASIEAKEESEPAMIKPRFQGVDRNNQPYIIAADAAVQQSEHMIWLDKVAADLTTEDKAWMALFADEGVYDTQQGVLLLQGDVQLYHDGGYEMRTERVRLNTRTLAAFGDSPVQIKSATGDLRADNFSIVQRGERLLFNHHVKMLLHPQ
jgi:lipopolysaccharide export system protein LptC